MFILSDEQEEELKKHRDGRIIDEKSAEKALFSRSRFFIKSSHGVNFFAPALRSSRGVSRDVKGGSDIKPLRVNLVRKRATRYNENNKADMTALKRRVNNRIYLQREHVEGLKGGGQRLFFDKTAKAHYVAKSGFIRSGRTPNIANNQQIKSSQILKKYLQSAQNKSNNLGVNHLRYIERGGAKLLEGMDNDFDISSYKFATEDGCVFSNISEKRKIRETFFSHLQRTCAEGGLTRRGGIICYSSVMELPHELQYPHLAKIINDFGEYFNKHRLPFVAVIHRPPSRGHHHNQHLHFIFHDRPFRDESTIMKFKHEEFLKPFYFRRDKIFTDSDNQQFGGREWLLSFRKNFVEAVNKALREAGHKHLEYSHLSYKDLGIDKISQQHLGPMITSLERDGFVTDIGYENLLKERTYELKKYSGIFNKILTNKRIINMPGMEAEEEELLKISGIDKRFFNRLYKNFSKEAHGAMPVNRIDLISETMRKAIAHSNNDLSQLLAFELVKIKDYEGYIERLKTTKSRAIKEGQGALYNDLLKHIFTHSKGLVDYVEKRAARSDRGDNGLSDFVANLEKIHPQKNIDIRLENISGLDDIFAMPELHRPLKNLYDRLQHLEKVDRFIRREYAPSYQGDAIEKYLDKELLDVFHDVNMKAPGLDLSSFIPGGGEKNMPISSSDLNEYLYRRRLKRMSQEEEVKDSVYLEDIIFSPHYKHTDFHVMSNGNMAIVNDITNKIKDIGAPLESPSKTKSSGIEIWH